jgi:RND superfamily putative drug exporter
VNKKTTKNQGAARERGFEFFGKIGRFSVRFRWFIVIFWIAIIPIVTSVFPNINNVAKNSNQDFLPKNSPSVAAQNLENKFQSKDTASNAVIVAARKDGPLTDADNAALIKIGSAVKQSHSVSEVKDEGISADGQARQIFVGINGDAFGQKALKVADDLRSRMKSVKAPAGLELHLTGDFAAGVDSANTNQKGRNSTEKYTVILILVLLWLVFRSVLAPIVTLLPAGLALAGCRPEPCGRICNFFCSHCNFCAS